MALSTKKLQKKRAKKQLKRKRNIKQLKSLSSPALHAQPIHEVVLSNKIFESGMGMGIVTRKNMKGGLVLACFKLDVYCLGVKDAYVSDISYEEYRLYKGQFEGHVEDQHLEIVEPGYLKAVIDGTVKFAQQCGFKPQGDFNKAMRHLSMFDPPDTLPDFEFGKDGNPLFIPGPYDSPKMIRDVLDTLSTHVGPDQFNCIMLLQGEPDFILDPEHR